MFAFSLLIISVLSLNLTDKIKIIRMKDSIKDSLLGFPIKINDQQNLINTLYQYHGNKKIQIMNSYCP